MYKSCDLARSLINEEAHYSANPPCAIDTSTILNIQDVYVVTCYAVA